MINTSIYDGVQLDVDGEATQGTVSPSSKDTVQMDSGTSASRLW